MIIEFFEFNDEIKSNNKDNYDEIMKVIEHRKIEIDILQNRYEEMG